MLRPSDQGGVGNGAPVQGDPLVPIGDIGGDKHPGRISGLSQHLRDHCRGGSLSVCPCDMDKFQALFGMPQPLQGPLHPLQPRLNAGGAPLFHPPEYVFLGDKPLLTHRASILSLMLP